ncbi:MAG: hypothetical protein ACP5RD_00500 [bacterium]|jgi:hypothetical protein
MSYLFRLSKISFILISFLTAINKKANPYDISFTTETTFNLYTKISTFEQGIKLDYNKYSIYITYQQIDNLDYSIIKQLLSKEISDKDKSITNKIYLLNQNQLGLPLEWITLNSKIKKINQL